MRETLYGRHAVLESLRAGRRTPYRLFILEGTVRTPLTDEIQSLARDRGARIDSASRNEMAQLVGHDQHQGFALETSEYPYADPQSMLELARARGEASLLLLLDLVQDIHNLGSLIRTAEAVGAHGLIIQNRRAAGITPAAVNSSSGAAEHLLIAQVTNLAREMEHLKDAGVWMVGLEDVPTAELYTALDLTISLGLVIGSEGEGLRRLVRERCDWLMRMPMRGNINSLNASIAGSIALYEVLRQRS